MAESCLLHPNSKAEFEENLKTHTVMITEFMQEGCPHCAATSAQLEKTCQNLTAGAPDLKIGFQACDIGPEGSKDPSHVFCHSEWLKSYAHADPKDPKGTPVIQAIPNDGSSDKPIWNIIGEEPEKIDQGIKFVVEQLQKAKSEQTRSAPPPAASSSAHLNEAITTYAATPSVTRQMNFATDAIPADPVPNLFCTPGVDCSTGDLSNRIVAYAFSAESARMLNNL